MSAHRLSGTASTLLIAEDQQENGRTEMQRPSHTVMRGVRTPVWTQRQVQRLASRNRCTRDRRDPPQPPGGPEDRRCWEFLEAEEIVGP